MLPGWIQRKAHPNFAAVYVVPHCALSSPGFMFLRRWGGPRCTSTRANNLSALIRCALATFSEWPEIYARLEEEALLHLPLVK
eukprot:5091807-Pyramimonas_sp.AAC.1